MQRHSSTPPFADRNLDRGVAPAAEQLPEPRDLVPEPSSSGSLPTWRRHLRWWLAVGVSVLLLILLPPLINANRYQRQIARSMSLSLGRPVHLDNVTPHLLPVPGLTLSNLVVSEDPAFGNEPTIRANTVEATLRLSSLWRRRVEFSTVRFVEPSVNLVRNAGGRWNLAGVLLHAAQVNTAPTAQRRAGPAPRFPYIEATGGRVNIKLDQEKLPFSLTDADFALWQPSPHQWRVRLRGQPDRTDANMTDPGELRIEGDLLQATTAEDVRVDLHASWHNAPLGEATLLVTGNDMGWRGRLNLEAWLAGTLDQAQIRSRLTLGGLRRAEFAPAHPLDLQIACGAAISIETVFVRGLTCTMPSDAPEPMALAVPELNLQRPGEAAATLSGHAIPSHWALLWAALFSPRVVTDLSSAGTLDVDLTHAAAGTETTSKLNESAAATVPEGAWSGSVQFTLPGTLATGVSIGAAAGADASATAIPLILRPALDLSPALASAGGRPLLRLDPLTIHPEADSGLLLNGMISTAGYVFSLAGTASRAELLAPARYLPQVGHDLETVLPSIPASAEPRSPPDLKVDFTCVSTWGSAQLCTPTRPSILKARGTAAKARRSVHRR